MISPSKVDTDVLTALNWRRSVKAFDADRKIEDSVWTQIEESLILTPSSFGLQPWKFVVVTDKEIRENLIPACFGQRQVADCSHLVVLSRVQNVDASHVESYIAEMKRLRSATDEQVAPIKGRMLNFVTTKPTEFIEAWATKQCYIALGNLMTVASTLAVDNCPMEGFEPAQVDEILGLHEKGCASVVICALGYRSADDKYAVMPKVRFPASQVVIKI